MGLDSWHHSISGSKVEGIAVGENVPVSNEAVIRVWGVEQPDRPPAFFVTEHAARSYSRSHGGTVFVARERTERPQSD